MSSVDPPSLPGVAHQTVSAGGVRLHLATAGPSDGPPLVLLHGWPQHWWAWRRVIAALSPTHRLIVPDLRGLGWSGEPPAGEHQAFAKQRLADDLLALLDVLGIERAGLIGHDWGAYACFLAALAAPERFTGLLALAIIHPWPSVGRVPDPRQVARLSYQGVIAAPVLGPRLLRQRSLMRAALQRTGGSVWSERDLDLYVDRVCSAAGARASVGLYRTFLLHELPQLVLGGGARGRLVTRTRLLVGDRDPVLDERSLAGYEDHAEDMRVEMVPGAAHFLPETHPELVAERAHELFG